MTKERAAHPDATEAMIEVARRRLENLAATGAKPSDQSIPPSPTYPQFQLEGITEFLDELVDLGQFEPDVQRHPLGRQRQAVAQLLEQRLEFVNTLDALEAAMNFAGWGRQFMSGGMPIDKSKINHLASRIRDRHLFRDVEAEFNVWSQLDGDGQTPQLVEQERRPDIFIPEQELWVEVKRVMPGTNPKNLSKRLSKTSRRAQALGKPCGIVFSISRSMLNHTEEDESFPRDIMPYVEHLDSQLRAYSFRGIAWCHIVWDAAPALVQRDGLTMVWIFLRCQASIEERPSSDTNLSNVMVSMLMHYPVPVIPNAIPGSTQLLPYEFAFSGLVV